MTVMAAAAVNLCALHPDIVASHILTRLDGQALASTACCSTLHRRFSSNHDLWSTVCRATWPSTTSPRLTHLISTFPNGGARAFFSQAFPILSSSSSTTTTTTGNHPPSELISAVDIHHNGNLILSKVQETETVSDWFRCSPFRIDLLDPKDSILTPMKHPEGDESCRELISGLTLSWIVIDPSEGRAVNLSSQNPVSVERHWLTGEVKVGYAAVIGGEVQCGIVVTCGASEEGEMQVREVGMEMEDLDGRKLKGRGSLVFLQRALEGKRGTGKNRVQQGKRRYNQFLERKRERRERRARTEAALDFISVAFGVSIFVAISCFLLCSK